MSRLSNVSKWVEKVGGQYRPKSFLKDRQSSWLTFPTMDFNSLPITLQATGTLTPAGFYQPNYEQTYETPLIVKSIVFEDSTDGTSSAAFTCRFFDTSTGRDLQNQPIHVRNIAGVALTPFLLPEPLILPCNNRLQCQFAKTTSGTTTMRMYLHGTELFPSTPNLELVRRIETRRRITSPMFYTTVTVPALAAGAPGASQSFTIKIGVGHFQMYGVTAVSSGNFRMEVSEVRTRRTLMNGQISQTNGIGTANYPHLFDVPYTIPEGEELRVTLADLANSGTNTVRLCFFGRNIYCPFAEVPEALRSTAINMEEYDS